ncbi:methylmalonyl-CoA mutase subunit beta [Neobacillus drentensis]|uniref:methylmalonyl-CoA mutase subunit beta n=1 Tax=Neobacillus drentensis TaxID=220684 RepID=UPI001F1E30E4|nr:methylmalonyl-CoA mutase subunit beta [Neobacillus drentensis]ULT55581.1 methylmalonyl-CoA mutase subunit beta [Neobacillus drentensis]
MELDSIKNQSFLQKTIEDWQEKAESTLKGKKIDSLHQHTYENIVLKPLYSRNDEKPVPDYPGGSDYRRGIDPLGYHTNKWKVAQQLAYQSPSELKEKLHDAVEKGQTAIAFKVSEELIETNHSLSSVLEGLYHQYPLAINAKGWQSAVLKVLAKLAEDENTADKVTGYIGSDPIALFAEEGAFSQEYIEEWKKNINKYSKSFSSLSTILIDTTPYHNGGANAVQELAIAIAEGVQYLDILQESELDLPVIVKKIVFQFSIGSNFFMEMAKLRAARVLWNRITELYGIKDEAQGMIISAETSSFTKSLHDPYVNLLRAGNEAFAAIIGGVQYLQVSPFDHLTVTTPFAERIARNIQLLLKHEAHLEKVIDPAGGSWYVEELTNELAEKAWDYFQKIEAQGGILNSLKSNWLQQEIKAVYDSKNLDIQTRKQSMVGTNVYADINEIASNPQQGNIKPFFSNGTYSLSKIEAIPARRLTEPFEELRQKAKQLEGKVGTIPSVGIVCLGELKHYKPRLDFMKGFLAAGGLNVIESKPIVTIEHAKQFILESTTSFFCFCGTNEQYELAGENILSVLKSEFPDRQFYLAGLPEVEKQPQWQSLGIKQFIHTGTNCYETLIAILTDMEVNTVEETKA